MKKIYRLFLPLLLLLAACQSHTPAPDAVLKSFVEALSRQDMEKARQLSTEDSKAMLDFMATALKNKGTGFPDEAFDPERIRFGETRIENKKAYVTVTDKRSGEAMRYTLKQEDGEWKVAFDMASLLEMGMEKMKEKGMKLPDNPDELLDDASRMNMDSLRRELDRELHILDSSNQPRL